MRVAVPVQGPESMGYFDRIDLVFSVRVNSQDEEEALGMKPPVSVCGFLGLYSVQVSVILCTEYPPCLSGHGNQSLPADIISPHIILCCRRRSITD
jgi:hypothetical protein